MMSSSDNIFSKLWQCLERGRSLLANTTPVLAVLNEAAGKSLEA